MPKNVKWNHLDIIHNVGVELAGFYLRFQWNSKPIKPTSSSCAGKVVLGSIPGDLWWIRQQFDTSFFQHFDFPWSLSFNHCSLLIFIYGHMLLLPKDKWTMLGNLRKQYPVENWGAFSAFLYTSTKHTKKGVLLWV
jgi:hypothetical protein